ncbi:hypothetical protein CROQUDRAFT_88103 [Cronartium quercuum f. sp. fusiforme G11]|uniref:Uncharacterized protein n=1 Tax=Cronartium quercuum f. sp. fusiforme G11 TaxID=708437 RepID=A0A9P6NTY4_9BASI|nr:hypothetical protein CROQUDRAFT_88103 [Cronartium quercuum f. sp. fusiforme G11]
MYNQTGTYVPLSTIADDLVKCLELTCKKVQKVHPNQSPAKGAEYIDTIVDLQLEMPVFADESAIAQWELYWDYGQAVKGYHTK